jgi:hypothetical protein
MHRGAETLLLLCLIAAALGCGHKEWPRAPAAQEVFHWVEAAATRTMDCAVVSGTLRGGYHNLDRITVQIEEMGEEPCLICPFSPQRAEQLLPADPQLTVRRAFVSAMTCGLDPVRTYRIRLVGHNVHLGLGTAESEVLFLPPIERR